MQAFHNTPTLGYIAWQDVHIQYKGTTYNIPNGNTDKRFVIWRYADPDCFYGSDEFPTLGPEDLLVFLNKNGTYAIVPKTQIVDGSLIVSDSIMTDAIAANAITTAKIAAGAITADLIAANAIGAGAIAAGAVTADKIAAGEIATTHLAALAVTADKIAANSVTADKVAANAIGAEKIAAGAITAEKLSIGVAEGMTGPIDADDRPISALSSQITLDQTGLKMKNADVQNLMMHLDANRLGFWDPTTGDPSIGIGDVADMATALGSDMQYGLLLAQGEIRATEAVIRASLAEGLVGQKHVENGSVTLQKLSDLLSVTIPDRFQRVFYQDEVEPPNVLTNPGFETGSKTGWTGTGTVSTSAKYDGSYGVQGAAELYQGYSATTERGWMASAMVRRNDASYSAGVRISCHDSSGTGIIAESAEASTGAWQLVKAAISAAANTASVRIILTGSSSGTTNYHDLCALRRASIGTDYTQIASHTIAASEACEQIRVEATVHNTHGKTVTIQVLVNGTEKATIASTATTVDASATIDVRACTGALTVIVKAKQSGGGYVYPGPISIYQNQRLPLRGIAPMYSVVGSTTASCGNTCERDCQTNCQISCQSSCQSSCQDSCQSACQSTCEQTSQGGGCWVAGTPVTVYLPESETATEIPVEQLEPGMQMPYYDPATDTLAITECLSNQRSYTHTVFVAEVEGGYTLEMTGEQPMDVLRAHLVTGQVMWHRVQARYLRVGDKLIRPCDKTLHEVLSIREESRARTWVWNPKTAARAYIAHGFADAISKT